MFEKKKENMTKLTTQSSIRRSQFGLFSVENAYNFDAKFDVGRIHDCIRKCYRNDAKMRSQIDDKSMNFRNLRFLDFCEEYNVKIVFLHDQGWQKC